jgi:putative membrane protein
MLHILVRWLINALILFGIPYVLPAVQVANLPAALIAALVIALLNTLIRPVLVLLTLPVTLITLGLFILVINAALFWLAAYAIDGFAVTGFWGAFWGALVYSVASWVINGVFGKLFMRKK